jgi:hypothetical protein
MPLSEKALENKKKYDLEYSKKHYKRVPLDMPIDDYNKLKSYCDKKGVGVNPFIKSAINEKMDRDK